MVISSFGDIFQVAASGLMLRLAELAAYPARRPDRCRPAPHGRRKIDTDLFDAAAVKLADVFKVDTGHQRIDSVHIRPNMARFGRIGIFVKGIDRFLVNLKCHHPIVYGRIDVELTQRYQGEKAKQCFAGVKPSDSKRVLCEVPLTCTGW